MGYVPAYCDKAMECESKIFVCFLSFILFIFYYFISFVTFYSFSLCLSLLCLKSFSFRFSVFFFVNFLVRSYSFLSFFS